jgi:hypothetical protein
VHVCVYDHFGRSANVEAHDAIKEAVKQAGHDYRYAHREHELDGDLLIVHGDTVWEHLLQAPKGARICLRMSRFGFEKGGTDRSANGIDCFHLILPFPQLELADWGRIIALLSDPSFRRDLIAGGSYRSGQGYFRLHEESLLAAYLLLVAAGQDEGLRTEVCTRLKATLPDLWRELRVGKQVLPGDWDEYAALQKPRRAQAMEVLRSAGVAGGF